MTNNTNSENNEEEFSVSGEKLLEKIKELIKEGNARKIIIKGQEGNTILEFPLNVGLLGAVLLPTLAAVGAVAALVTKCTIVVVKK